MSRKLILGTVSAIGLAGAVSAEVPSVAADIPPVHSLVSIVMDGVGTPDLLVQPGASPHGYSLRPSEAAALNNADAVFWIGEALEPWLEGSIEALAGDAQVIELLEADGTTTLAFREGATFEAHSHDHGDHDHAGHDHEDHDGHEHDHDDDHAHDDEHDHDHEHGDDEEHGHGEEHDHEHGDEHAHGEEHDHDDHAHDDHDHEEHAHDEHHHHHDGNDPHAWLDPENGRVWLYAIAAELSELDPENAETYRANAEAGKADIEALIGEISAQLEPMQGTNFIVFHDAYQYFETRFDVPASGSITLGDASDPSPARIEEIQQKVSELGVSCAFTEPQFNPDLVATVFRGTDAKTGVMDPLGADLEPGPNLYPELLRNLASSLTSCLD